MKLPRSKAHSWPLSRRSHSKMLHRQTSLLLLNNNSSLRKKKREK